MKKILKPQVYLGACPVLMVSCGTEKPNIVTLAWSGIVNSVKPMVSISVRKERYSHSLIKENGEFVINTVDSKLLEACDGCGVLSGRNIDKFKHFNLTPKYGTLKTPYIEESPVSIECKTVSVTELGTHDMFIAEVVSVISDENLSTSGKLGLAQPDLVCYVSGTYYSVGEKLGKYGFSVKK